jgi:radical SAM protein with 4Fe4S-binding SPASM domain
MDSIASFGAPSPHLVLTGGDPLQRKDLFEVIAYARSLGIKVSVTPAATPLLTFDALRALKEAGVDSIALSIDGSTAERHDAIRQVCGCFERTVQGAVWAGEIGLPLQVNTLVSEETQDDLMGVYELLHSFPVMRWSLFMLIAVGRGRQLNELSPEAGEAFMEQIQGLVRRAPFPIKTTEAPSYRRIAHQRMLAAHMSPQQIRESSVFRGFGIRDGNGVVFISHLGQVYPSGFLPVAGGSIRNGELVDIYRNSELFVKMRDVDSYSGKCGKCEYRRICGGSRARAYAYTGDPCGSDPFCPYQPSQANLEPEAATR